MNTTRMMQIPGELDQLNEYEFRKHFPNFAQALDEQSKHLTIGRLMVIDKRLMKEMQYLGNTERKIGTVASKIRYLINNS